MRRVKLSMVCAGAIAVLAGCAGDEDVREPAETPTPSATPSATPSPTSSPEPTPTPAVPTFEWIRTNVVEVSCAGADCHTGGGHASLVEYDEVVNAIAEEGPYCDGRIRVVPGSPEESLFYLKLLESPPCGARMPLGAPPLPAETISEIERWILAGAPE